LRTKRWLAGTTPASLSQARAAESGRQPWIVQGLLRTADAASPVPGASVATSLVLFVLVYGVVFSFGIYFINRLIAAGIREPALPEQTPHLAAGHHTFKA
jgi:cytochrome d ubiquinol oxidase subunit I